MLKFPNIPNNKLTNILFNMVPHIKKFYNIINIYKHIYSYSLN